MGKMAWNGSAMPPTKKLVVGEVPLMVRAGER